MNTDQRVAADIRELKRTRPRYVQGVVTDVSPIEVRIAGSEVPVAALAFDGYEYSIDQRVTIAVWGSDLVVVGHATTDPQAAGGGGPTYSAGDGLDLSGTSFSLDLKSGGGLKIDSTELAADFGSGSGKVTQGNDSRLSDQRTPIDGSVTAAKVAGSLKPSGSASGTDEALRRLGTGSTHAAAGDDGRFPTAGQKNALAGTSGTPGTGNEFATKQTTDALASAITSASTADRNRANHTGSQDASTISDFDAQVRSSRVDQMATATSPVTVPAATGSGHAVNLGQQQQAILQAQAGYRRIPDVDFIPRIFDAPFGATYETLPPHTRSGNVITGTDAGQLMLVEGPYAADLATVGFTIALVNEGNGAGDARENGIYTVTRDGAGGGGAGNWQFTRHPDFDTTGDLVQGNLVRSSHAGRQFYLVSPDPVVMNTDIQTWEPFQFYPAEHALTHSPSGEDPLPLAAAGTIQPDDSAAEGSAESFARSDHRHAIAAAAAGTIQPDDTSAEGSSASFARADHRHAIAAAAASAITGANAEGSSDSFARADHNHALPNWGTYFAAPFMTAPAAAAVVANRVYYAQIQVLNAATLTGIQIYAGSGSGTCRVALYDSTGARVANRTANTGTVPSLAALKVDFSSPYAALPGVYFVAVVFSGTPTILQAGHVRAGFTAGPGSNATATSITPPTALESTPCMTTY